MIEQLLVDPNIRVCEDGSILTNRDVAGHIQQEWRPLYNKHRDRGYAIVAYGGRKARKKLQVHRIIYAKFVGKLDTEMVINHIDGNPQNNHFTNLEMVTQSDNVRHMYRTLHYKQPARNSKLTFAQASKIREEYSDGREVSVLAEKYKVSKATIYGIINFKTWTDK